ncbi:hypothetical protein ACFFQF_04750 [Haladaptatus pallidirubidus]|uniref:Zinc ribbon domain-containing protein n=1 Tax=Haladaptatus pallidirubidus TaxID=1008152 RepID=A0AAV3UL69_9EURY|nr:hypothetical protein [Haladaptatus pallidirubidus]
MQRMRPGGGRIFRIFILLIILSLGRRLFFGDQRGGLLGGTGIDSAILVGLGVGVFVIGGVLAYRAGMFSRNASSSETTTEPPEGGYVCRYCGTNLERFRNRCPYCETRNPVTNPDE